MCLYMPTMKNASGQHLGEGTESVAFSQLTCTCLGIKTGPAERRLELQKEKMLKYNTHSYV